MGNQFFRATLAVSAVVVATAVGWGSSTTPAHAEPECTNGSNDFDGNGYADLAIGSPGEQDGRGGVTVMLGNGGGEGSNFVYVPAPDGQPGDQFGAAVAEVAYYEDELDTSACTQLVVGAPGRDVAGSKDAGAVYVFTWDQADNRFSLARTLALGQDGVPGLPHSGARFGTSLAAPYHGPDIGSVVTPLYVGAPGYVVDGPVAGAVAQLRLTGGSDDPQVGSAKLLTQGSAGVPGTPENGDAFGRSLAALDNGVLVGSPGENGNAGGVVRWRENDSGPAKFLTQNSSGVPGTSEAGDEFGAAVYAAHETRPAGGGYYLLVGAPGEAIGNVQEAGAAIRFVYHGDLEMTKTKGFNQNSTGVAGTAESGDLFGSSFGSFGPQHLLVGAPGEAIGTLVRAGMVQSLAGSQAWHQSTKGVGGVAERNDRFGATMGNALVPITGEPDDGWLSSIAIGVPGEGDNAGAAQVGLPGGSGMTRYINGGVQAGDRLGAALGKTN